MNNISELASQMPEDVNSIRCIVVNELLYVYKLLCKNIKQPPDTIEEICKKLDNIIYYLIPKKIKIV